MPRGRPKSNRDMTYIHCVVDSQVLAETNLHLFDPILGRVKYGILGDLIGRLLRDWNKKQQTKKEGPHVGTTADTTSRSK